MNFETRLKNLHNSPATAFEIDVATVIYERMVTAKAICLSVLGANATDSAVVTVLEQLSAESRSLMQNNARLLSEGAR